MMMDAETQEITTKKENGRRRLELEQDANELPRRTGEEFDDLR